MLQNLRQHAQGWIAGIIVAILCLAFALWGVEYYVTQSQTTSAVAKVNGVKITQEEWDSAYRRLRQQQKLPEESGALSEAMQKQLQTVALNKLIAQQVLSDAATREGFSISPEQLGSIIAQTPVFQENGQFSPWRYQQLVRQLYPSEQEFLAALKQEALIWQPKIGIETSAFVLPEELDRVLALLLQKRNFAYLLIPAAAFLSQVAVNPDEIKAYYSAHQDRFLSPEQLSLQYIELSAPALSNAANVNENEINQYYQEHASDFSGKSVAQVHDEIAKNLRQQKTEQLLVEKTDQLANLAYTNPDTLTAAAQATGLPIKTTGFFARGARTGIMANPKIVMAAFSDTVLKQRNNSDIIPLDNQSVIVLRVGSYKPPQLQPIAEVTPLIQEQLQKIAAQKKAQVLGNTILTELKQGAALTAVAAKQHVTWKEGNGIMRDHPADVPADIVQFGFTLAKPTEKMPSFAATALSNGDYVVVALLKIENAVPSNVAAAERQRIRADLASQQGQLDYLQYVTAAMHEAKIKQSR